MKENDTEVKKKLKELDNIVGGVSDYQKGLSSFLGNQGDWCTLTVECQPNCNKKEK